MTTARRGVQVKCSPGVHLRAASVMVRMAERFRAEVWIENDGACANGKSIMSLLTLAAVEGAALEIVALGDDAEEAVEAIAKLVEGGLPEI